jgi:serine/threonine protein kinase
VGVRVLVPLLASGGTLVGIVGVGDKKSELAFSTSDLSFLSAAAAAASPAFEARLLRGADASVRAAGIPPINWRDEPAVECELCGRIFEGDRLKSCSCGGSLRVGVLPKIVLGKFDIDRRIGAGGMGVVYRATDIALGRSVAIKTLPRIVPESARRLRQEARLMAAVTHPNLAVIYGAETWRATPILIVELLEGRTLADRLRDGPLNPLDAAALGRALAAALDHLHRAGLLHRDVKPSNIGFTSDGTPKLLDFGVAQFVNEWEQPDTVVGTPLYLSPEAVRGLPADESFDLWALAMVLYEAIAGRHPWGRLPLGELLDHIDRHTMPDIVHLQRNCPEQMRDFLRHSLAAERNRRPATAREMVHELTTASRALESLTSN